MAGSEGGKCKKGGSGAKKDKCKVYRSAKVGERNMANKLFSRVKKFKNDFMAISRLKEVAEYCTNKKVVLEYIKNNYDTYKSNYEKNCAGKEAAKKKFAAQAALRNK